MIHKRYLASRQPYTHLISTIGQILEEGRRKALQSVNQILVKTYWEIGKQIVEFEQQGKEKAEYGADTLDTAELLAILLGRGSKGESVLELSHKLLKDYNLHGLETLVFLSYRHFLISNYF